VTVDLQFGKKFGHKTRPLVLKPDDKIEDLKFIIQGKTTETNYKGT